jgi:hypothetical protein
MLSSTVENNMNVAFGVGLRDENTGPKETSLVDDLSRKQAFKKFSYRGLDISKLLGLTMDELAYNIF